jgi:hypothetical protein
VSYDRRGWERIRIGEASRTRVVSLHSSILIGIGKALTAIIWWFSDEKNSASYNIYIFLRICL